MKYLLKKVPSYFVFIAIALCCVCSYAFTKFSKKSCPETIEPLNNITTNSCNVNISRLNGRKFIRPLLFAERACEFDNFSSIKTSLNQIIVNLKANKSITDASVYVRLFNNGEWFSINDEVKYQPGSLFKVPLLITILRLEEKQNGFINKQLTFNAITKEAKEFKQEFVKDKIAMGKTYSIKELLKYMIVNSDNNATMLLFNTINPLEFEKTFTDLGLDKNMTKSEGVVSTKDYSKFWLTLYNGSYLNFDNSEYALNLLSQSDFKDGIKKAIPGNVLMAHKFGEKGNGTNFCLHETGLVYSNDKPYLVTIMTVGNNQSALPNSIQQIATAIHNGIEGYTK